MRGQLGYGDISNTAIFETCSDSGQEYECITVPVSYGVPLGAPAVRVAVGKFHTCAILNDGSLKCWGWYALGRLGVGDDIDNFLDVPPLDAIDLGEGRTALEVTAGATQTCAVLDDHSMKCWGYGAYGRHISYFTL